MHSAICLFNFIEASLYGKLLFSYSSSAIRLLKLAGSFIFKSFCKNDPTLATPPPTDPPIDPKLLLAYPLNALPTEPTDPI